jgi:pilus assembly protein Flp/PilA
MIQWWGDGLASAIEVVARGRRRGQGLVEYALIIVLVALVVVAALTLLGPAISNIFDRISSAL